MVGVGCAVGARVLALGLMPWVMRLGVWLFLGWSGASVSRVSAGQFVTVGVQALMVDEPESLILAQSERWRHA